MNIENAEISSTALGVKHTDHGILSFGIFTEYDGGGQSYGQLVLDTYDAEKKERVPTDLAAGLLLAVDAVFGVDWEDLKGQHCRVARDKDYGPILAIGHFLKDEWLWYDETANEFRTGKLKEVPHEAR